MRYLATGTGISGSSRAYLETSARKCTAIGIDDPEVSALLADVHGYAS